MLDIDVNSKTFGATLVSFNYRTAMPCTKLLDGQPHNRQLCEIAVSPVNDQIVLLNIKRTNLIRYDVSRQEAKLLDTKAINASSKTFFFGATFSFGGKVCDSFEFIHWKITNAFFVNVSRMMIVDI